MSTESTNTNNNTNNPTTNTNTTIKNDLPSPKKYNRKIKDKLKHSRNETKRRARITTQFNILQNILQCKYKDRYNILQITIDICNEYMKNYKYNIENIYTHVPIFIIDLSGNLMDMNTSFLNLMKINKKYLDNKSIFQFFQNTDVSIYDIINFKRIFLIMILFFYTSLCINQ
jgi:hypothetical protein